MAKSNLTIQSRFTVQRREQVLQPYQQRLAAARAAGDSLAEIDALAELGRAWSRQRDYTRAVAAYEQQLAILRLLGNSPGEAEALSALSGVYLAQGEYRRALLAAEQSLDIQHRVGDRATDGGECDALLNMAASYAALGNLRGAAVAYEEELAHARASGQTQLEAFVLDELGQTYVNLDQPGARSSVSSRSLSCGAGSTTVRARAERMSTWAAPTLPWAAHRVPALHHYQRVGYLPPNSGQHWGICGAEQPGHAASRHGRPRRWRRRVTSSSSTLPAGWATVTASPGA